MTKFMFMGSLICAFNALILLIAFDSVGGFLLGVFGFVICIMCASLTSNFAE
jgi:hypothetical protein